MIEGISELIESHNIQSHQLENIKEVLKRFNNVKMPSTLQYSKLVSDLNNILFDEDET
jgi:hypothetical protein